MSRPLDGKIAVVTGSSRGIGRGTAIALGELGATVYVTGRTTGSGDLSIDTTVKMVEDAGGKGVAVQVDHGDDAQIAGLFDRVRADVGRIDVLVNNAGVFFSHPVDETSYEEWQRAWEETIAVNLTGPANVTWCAVRHMGRGGRVINIGSRGAFRGAPHSPAYGATKAGIAAFGQSLAKYLGSRGIAVTTIAPGFVDTEMATEAMEGEGGEIRRAESPFGRIATAEEIAAAVVY
ncbi:MAG: SDR family NAD(P)-dependent oxidoreductase, partial [Ilumatobacteraceae bacterium]